MSASHNNKNSGYSKLVERHHRRPHQMGTATVGGRTNARPPAGRRRGLPDDYQAELEEQDYQSRYEQQWEERRQHRANERKDSRKKSTLAGRVAKRPRATHSPEAVWRWTKIALIGLAGLILLLGTFVAYDRLAGSSLFLIKEIELQGTKQVAREELLQLLTPYKAQSLWQVDLQALRREIEKNPWIIEAEVSRVLPDSLRIRIHEREPVAPWRAANGSVVWVDREGRSLGDLNFNQVEKIPPVINGLEEGSSEEVLAANRRRMEIYQTLMRELDDGSTKLSEEIDEVDLKNVQGIRLHLMKRKLNILLGEADFRARLEKALKLLAAIERRELSSIGFLNQADAERLIKGDRLAYLNVTHPERMVIGFAE